MQRIDRFLSEAGIESRRKVKDLVRSGRVCVNGIPVTAPELKIDENRDLVTLDGEMIRGGNRRIVLMLHKPAGCVTAAVDREHKTVMEYLPREYQKLMPIGRLDKETEGLLLFTNDGDLAHRLIAPKRQIPKRYYAEHPGMAGAEDIAAFAAGCVLKDGTVCLPAKLEPLGEGRSIVTVVEGKYHQVRRMLASRAMPVHYLRRISEGGISLGELPLGMSRELSQEEIALLETGNFDEESSLQLLI